MIDEIILAGSEAVTRSADATSTEDAFAGLTSATQTAEQFPVPKAVSDRK